MGGRAHFLLAGPEPPDEQGLRKASRDERGVGLRGDESLDGEAFGSLMNLLRQFRVGLLRSSRLASADGTMGRDAVP